MFIIVFIKTGKVKQASQIECAGMFQASWLLSRELRQSHTRQPTGEEVINVHVDALSGQETTK